MPRPVRSTSRTGRPRPAGHIIKIVGFLIVAFLAWAGLTTLQEVTRGDGRIIPSSKMQVIQSAEPGVVREILVREGQRVEKGDVLARIDNTLTSSGLGELSSAPIRSKRRSRGFASSTSAASTPPMRARRRLRRPRPTPAPTSRTFAPRAG